jgi:hypothetical protein
LLDETDIAHSPLAAAVFRAKNQIYWVRGSEAYDLRNGLPDLPP